jgi:adenosylcobinamide-phosphate synthase
MVPAEVILPVAVLFLALVVDRLIGDPHSAWHPVALVGRFIGWWGKPGNYSPRFQRIAGVFFWLVTVGLFSLPFLVFSRAAPWYLWLIVAPFLLKSCFAWRSLEEHTLAVAAALKDGVGRGREKVGLLVSRDTAALGREHILSAGYESMTENLNDSIVAPLFWFIVTGPFGLVAAAVYRAANTMDAMLGYRDERIRLGWFPARMDDILSFIPARVTVLLLLVWFGLHGRFRNAWRMMRRDGRKRPGFNGGIIMAAMAGGCGIRFEKPGVYTIGDPERSLDEAGRDIVTAARAVTLMLAILAGSAVILLGGWINSTGI